MNARNVTMATTLAIAFLVGPLASAGDESAKQAILDATITARIETTFLFNEHLNPFDINTTTKDGVVTLDGVVEDDIERQLAGAIAKSVENVKEIENNLTLEFKDKTPAAATAEALNYETGKLVAWRKKVDDANLEATVRTQLDYAEELDEYPIVVTAKDRKVTLGGAVKSEDQKLKAEHIAKNTKGVNTVENDIEVMDDKTFAQKVKKTAKSAGDAISDEWIEKQVQRRIAFNRNLSIFTIDVEVEDNTCKLTGEVLSEAQRDLAELVARQTSGVQNVENEIAVTAS